MKQEILNKEINNLLRFGMTSMRERKEIQVVRHAAMLELGIICESKRFGSKKNRDKHCWLERTFTNEN